MQHLGKQMKQHLGKQTPTSKDVAASCASRFPPQARSCRLKSAAAAAAAAHRPQLPGKDPGAFHT